MIDFVVDENVQIHGGNGFVRDYPAERHYRDARVNRIFEGTNEINRLLVPGMLVKRALKGGLPLIAAAKRLQDELLTPVDGVRAGLGERSARDRAANGPAMKKTSLMVLGLAMQTYGDALAHEQEVADARVGHHHGHVHRRKRHAARRAEPTAPATPQPRCTSTPQPCSRTTRASRLTASRAPPSRP